MTNYWYIRVSSADQKTDRQLDQIELYAEKNGIELDRRKIYIDNASGKDFNRPKYKELKKALNKSDTLHICSLDRLGRNKDMVLEEWKDITKNIGADIVVLDLPLLNTKQYKVVDSEGNTMANSLVADLVLQVLTYMSEEERKKIKIRQREGINSARKRGKHLGRPRKNYDSFSKEEKEEFELQYKRWKRGEQTAVRTYEELELSKATFYRIVKEFEQLQES